MQVFGGNDAESYYDEGLTAFKKGDIQRAGKCFKRAINLDPEFTAAAHQLAKCYDRIGKIDRAVQILRRVIASKPTLLTAKLDLAYCLLDLGHHEEARKLFLDVVEVQPGNPRATLGLANVCFIEGNWDGAATLAQNARNMGGDSFATLFLLGRATKLAGAGPVSKGVLEEADSVLERSIQLNPDQPESYFLRGEVAFVIEQFATALEHYTEAQDRAKPDELYSAFGERFSYLDILAKRGLCYQRLGKPDRAHELGLEIEKSDPDHKIGRALAAL